MTIYASVLGEGGLLICSVTIFKTRHELTFGRRHAVPTNSQALWKTWAWSLLDSTFTEIKDLLFNNEAHLKAKTLQQYCRSWPLSRIGMTKSIFPQIFRVNLNAYIAAQRTAQNNWQGTYGFFDCGKKRLYKSLNQLRVVDLWLIYSENGLTKSVSKVILVIQLLNVSFYAFFMLYSTNCSSATVFQKEFCFQMRSREKVYRNWSL